MFTYTIRSLSAARLEISTCSSSLGLADLGEALRILGVEVLQVAPGRTSGYTRSPTARRISAAVMRRCSAVATISSTSSTPVAGGELDHVLEDRLADVGRAHRRQRDRDVVDRDRELHARDEQLGKRLRVTDRVQQRVTHGRRHVADARQRVGGIDDPRAERELLHAVALALVHEQRGRPLVHLQHESGSGHLVVS